MRVLRKFYLFMFIFIFLFTSFSLPKNACKYLFLKETTYIFRSWRIFDYYVQGVKSDLNKRKYEDAIEGIQQIWFLLKQRYNLSLSGRNFDQYVFSSYRLKYLIEKKSIRRVLFPISSRCPRDCVYCFNGKEFKKHIFDIDKEMFFSFIDLITEDKNKPPIIQNLALTGGDPFLHPNILEFISYVDLINKKRSPENRLYLNFLTTTLPFNNYIIDLLASKSWISLHISYPTHDSKFYEELFGASNDLFRIQKNIDELYKAGKSYGRNNWITTLTPTMKLTYPGMSSTISWLLDKEIIIVLDHFWESPNKDNILVDKEIKPLNNEEYLSLCIQSWILSFEKFRETGDISFLWNFNSVISGPKILKKEDSTENYGHPFGVFNAINRYDERTRRILKMLNYILKMSAFSVDPKGGNFVQLSLGNFYQSSQASQDPKFFPLPYGKAFEESASSEKEFLARKLLSFIIQYANLKID